MFHCLRLFRFIVVALAMAASSAAFAQYPNRPVTLIVPWGAGGGTDATARIIATLAFVLLLIVLWPVGAWLAHKARGQSGARPA